MQRRVSFVRSYLAGPPHGNSGLLEHSLCIDEGVECCVQSFKLFGGRSRVGSFDVRKPRALDAGFLAKDLTGYAGCGSLLSDYLAVHGVQSKNLPWTSLQRSALAEIPRIGTFRLSSDSVPGF